MKAKEWRVTLTVIVTLAFAVILFIAWQRSRPAVASVSDEQAAGDALLAEKLSGPGYFKTPIAGIREQGGPWIDVSEAIRQLPRIVAERKLDPDSVQKVEAMISELAEPHPYRIVGGGRIKLSRLNLSLDSLKQ